LVDSYVLFLAGVAPPAAEGADAIARGLAYAFRIGIQMTIPVVVAGFLLYLGAGLLNRLMPQMMVFFVVMPLQIIFAFSLLMITLSAALYWFVNYFDESLALLSGYG
jgi:flagellar biosynthetic protein FliR